MTASSGALPEGGTLEETSSGEAKATAIDVSPTHDAGIDPCFLGDDRSPYPDDGTRHLFAHGIRSNGAREGRRIQAIVRASEQIEAADIIGVARTVAQQSDSKRAPAEASLPVIFGLCFASKSGGA